MQWSRMQTHRAMSTFKKTGNIWRIYFFVMAQEIFHIFLWVRETKFLHGWWKHFKPEAEDLSRLNTTKSSSRHNFAVSRSGPNYMKPDKDTVTSYKLKSFVENLSIYKYFYSVLGILRAELLLVLFSVWGHLLGSICEYLLYILLAIKS